MKKYVKASTRWFGELLDVPNSQEALLKACNFIKKCGVWVASSDMNLVVFQDGLYTIYENGYKYSDEILIYKYADEEDKEEYAEVHGLDIDDIDYEKFAEDHPEIAVWDVESMDELIDEYS